MKKIINLTIIMVLALTTPIHANPTKGKYIIINNQSTDSYKIQSTGKLKTNQSKNKSVQQKSTNPNAIDKVLSEPEDAKLYKGETKYKVASLQNKREFTVTNFKTNKEEVINADLKYSGKKAEIWVHQNKISNAQAIRIGQEFDNKIHPLITKNFGEESDLDKNSKINILIYDIKDNFEETNTFIQGYFNAKDLYDVEGSNKGEILYIDTYPTMDITDSDNNQGIENLYPIIVHEFQHMVSYNENRIKENGQALETWIDEGLSLAAEQIYTNKPRMDRINYYNTSNSIQNGHSLLYWDYNYDTLSNYSLSYLFMEYLNAQSNVGEGIYKEIIQNSNNNYKAVEEVVKKYIDSNMNFGEFMTNFRIALVLNESNGKYGFKNMEGFDKLQKRIYRGSQIDLRGGGSVVIEVDDLFEIPKDRGADIVYIGSDSIEKSDKNHIKITGENRYDTAVKISNKAFENGSDSVILINGENSSDGLSAGPFASLINASMLLVEKDSIPKETFDEIKRLKPKKIYIIGGESCISSKVINSLKDTLNIKEEDINRIGGKDREETSLLICNEIAKQSDIENIYVVNGYKGEADAMSILSKACSNKSPILITNGTKLDENQRKFIQSIEYPSFYFIGGGITMSEDLLNEIEGLFDVELSFMRVYGENRQDTNARIVEYFYEDKINKLIVCKSDNLIDALCVGVFAGKENIPVLIASNNLSNEQEFVIKSKTYNTLIEVGGGINSKVINSLK